MHHLHKNCGTNRKNLLVPQLRRIANLIVAEIGHNSTVY